MKKHTHTKSQRKSKPILLIVLETVYEIILAHEETLNNPFVSLCENKDYEFYKTTLNGIGAIVEGSLDPLFLLMLRQDQQDNSTFLLSFSMEKVGLMMTGWLRKGCSTEDLWMTGRFDSSGCSFEPSQPRLAEKTLQDFVERYHPALPR